MEGKRDDLPEEEIDLYELLLKLKRRWRVILGTVLGFAFISLSYLIFVAEPLYRVSVFVRPGIAYYSQSGEPRLSFEPRDFSRLITGVDLYLKSFKHEFEKKFRSDIPKINSNVKGGVIEIYIFDSDPEIGKKKIEFLLEKIKTFLEIKTLKLSKKNLEDQIKNLNSEIEKINIEEKLLISRMNVLQKKLISARTRHRNLLQEKKKVKERIDLLKGELSSLEKEAEDLRKVIERTESSMKANLDLTSRITLNSYLGNLRIAHIGVTSKIIDIKREINSLEAKLLGIDTAIRETEARITDVEFKMEDVRKRLEKLRIRREVLRKRIDTLSLKKGTIEPLEVLAGPVSSPEPEKPKGSMIVGVSLVTSLLLGVFLALLVDWLEEARRRHQGT